jgi:flagellar basal-body rod protein FlgC
VDSFRAIEISAAGLTAEKARIEAATLNLANMNTSAAPGTAGYRPVTAVIRSVPTRFAQMLDGRPQTLALAKAEIVPQTGAALRTAYEPGHPDADAAGMVSYPAIDHTQEMMTVMTALRAYEANLTALQATRTLAAKALEIGGE